MSNRAGARAARDLRSRLLRATLVQLSPAFYEPDEQSHEHTKPESTFQRMTEAMNAAAPVMRALASGS